MTKKEFKRAMVCGLGRCIQALDAEGDIEKYRDIIMWGCTHEIFYDAQCEGTKSLYLYKLVCHYSDVSLFIEAVVACAGQQMTKNSWLFFQCCEFLSFFGADGDKEARQSLYDIYMDLFRILRHKKRRTKYGISPEQENFENLCIAIVNMESAKENRIRVYCKIVEDIGSLMINSSLIDAWSFAWFQDCMDNEFGEKYIHGILMKQEKKSEAVRYYVAAIQQRQKDMENWGSKRAKMPSTAEEIYDRLAHGGSLGHDIPILIIRRFVKSGQDREMKKLAAYHKKEQNEEIRAQITGLMAQKDSVYLLDVDVLIADCSSENKLLQEYAFQALSYTRHKKVREYAFELMGDVENPDNILKKAEQLEHFESIFNMLIYNYEREDAGWFVEAVKAIPVLRREKINWHSIYSCLLDMFKIKNVVSPPKDILYHMYETGRCSCCREYIVREMSRRRMLTEEILQECLYDSDSDIRKFAERKTGKVPIQNR